MSWAQITLSRFAISVWRQKRQRQGTGQSCPATAMPPETPFPAMGAPQAGRCPPLPPVATRAAAGCWRLSPRAQHPPPHTESPRMAPASSLPGTRSPMAWRATPEQAPSPQVRPRKAPRRLLPAPRPLIASLPPAGSPGEVLSLQLLFSCNTRVPRAISSAERERRGEGEPRRAPIAPHRQAGPPPPPRCPAGGKHRH